MLKNISILFIILLLTGCSSSKKAIIANSLDAVPVVTGSVLNASAFQKGGSLVLGFFKPGPGAAADDETDQLSWMLTKGIKDTLPEDNTRFIISLDTPKEADYLLDGHIEDYTRKGHKARLSIDGQVWLRDAAEKIAVFQTSVSIDLKDQNPKTVAYRIGIAIAHFMGSHTS